MIMLRGHKLVAPLIILCMIPAISGAFIHPNQLQGKGVQSEHQRGILEKTHLDYTQVDVVAGGHIMSAYGVQEGFVGVHYGIINPAGTSFRIDIAYSSNKDNAGATLKSIPVMANVLFGYPLVARIDSYVGAGVGLILFQDAIAKMGLGYQWFTGVAVELTPDAALFSEYGRQYCRVDNQSLDAELVKFGLTFKFFPR